jgi:hypothetical protein
MTTNNVILLQCIDPIFSILSKAFFASVFSSIWNCSATKYQMLDFGANVVFAPGLYLVGWGGGGAVIWPLTLILFMPILA